MKKMKKVLALALSASMMMGMSMTSMAAEQEVSVDAPIYAYDVTNVVVPTTFEVAFNPNKLDVDKGGGTVVQDQIVSKNYGIINKSTKDKVITVTFNVEDLNEGKITFATDPADVTGASDNDYVINLTVVPADTTEVQVGGASASLTTTGADLADATMTPAASNAKVLAAGENDVDFLLEKAVYSGTIDLGSSTGNNVADDFTIQSLAAAGKGITAFSFGGTMNENTDWTKLTKGIRITAIYGNDNATTGASAVSGTGALYENPNPVFKTGSEVGTIKFKTGTGSDELASITKIEMDCNGTIYDGYNDGGRYWPAAVNENGLITFSSAYMKLYIDAYAATDATREATVTYETTGGVTKTATVNVRLKEVEITGPSFTTGSAVGTINYESGSGDDAVASITKIEMDCSGTIYDGYNDGGRYWAAATDSDGLITFAAEYVKLYSDAYTTDATREATVTYVTVGGDTKTATVAVKIR